MGRVLWAWCLAWLLLVGVAANARAGDFGEIRVCVRPPNVPAGVEAWVYTPGSATVVVKVKREDFKKQSGGLTTYLFDPNAPAENTKLLPVPFNKLPCPARVLPVKPLEAPPAAKKAEPPNPADKKQVAGDNDHGAKDNGGKTKNDEPPGLPKPLVYPQGKGKLPPQLEPKLPETGVTAHWPATVLPVVKRGDSGTLLPTTTVLPTVRRGRIAAGGSGNKGATGDGTNKGGGVEKTPFETFAEEMAYGGAIANQQFNEDTKRPDGSRYGIPGGKNATGPNNPVAQAAAGTVLVAAAVITAGGFDKKIIDAFRKKTPLLISGTGKLAEDAAEQLVDGIVAKQGEKGRLFLADVLNKNGAIGEYSIMKRFTDKLGGRLQAHHILEKKMAEKFELGATDKIPSVILTEAEHKAITAKLKVATARVDSVQKLWHAYETAYVDYPGWLAAIKPYFSKVK